MIKPTSLLLGWMGLCSVALSQETQQTQLGQAIQIIASPKVVDLHVPAPPILPPSERAANITVNYTGFTPEAQDAFQYAIDIWESLLEADQPIEIDATWASLAPTTLGSASSFISRNFAGAPNADTWYVNSMANQFAGFDVSGNAEITATFNSDFSNWYLGTDGNTPSDKYDFVSVVLHEIGHGLGFAGSAGVNDAGLGSIGQLGDPYVYDYFTQLGDVLGSGAILGYSGLPAALGNALTSDLVHWNGPKAVAFNGGEAVDLYSPDPWDGGSSYSHFNDATFDGTPHALMTHAIGTGETIHNPGNIALGLLQDIGWELACEQWYLPNDVEGGPAIFACFAPDGYTLAENQGCAADIIASDSYCVDTNWDDICQEAYECCLTPIEGCTISGACNYDPNACTDDGSCILFCFDNCFRIEMTDSFGDGWNGATWSLSTVDTGLGIDGGSLGAGPSGVQGACIADGCYQFQVTQGTYPSEIGWTIYGIDGDPISGGAGESFVVSFGDLSGCTNPRACNYNEDACNEDGSCIYEDNPITDMTSTQWVLSLDNECSGPELIYLMDFNDDYTTLADDGVTGTWRLCGDVLNFYEGLFTVYDGTWSGSEFDGEFTTFAGSGCMNLAPAVFGCIDPTACNYDADANWPDGSCTFPGCQDAMACDYDPLAGCEGPCAYPPAYLEGCTNPMSSNYSPIATVDDGSCDLSYMCGEGTVYDEVLGICVTNECVGDFNGDGSIGAADLIDFLVFYGTDCD